MPVRVFSISSMLICHAWQDGFEIVYGKGKGSRPQAAAAAVPAPKAAPAADPQPAQQPPPQVRSQACKGAACLTSAGICQDCTPSLSVIGHL